MWVTSRAIMFPHNGRSTCTDAGISTPTPLPFIFFAYPSSPLSLRSAASPMIVLPWQQWHADASVLSFGEKSNPLFFCMFSFYFMSKCIKKRTIKVEKENNMKELWLEAPCITCHHSLPLTVTVMDHHSFVCLMFSEPVLYIILLLGGSIMCRTADVHTWCSDYITHNAIFRSLQCMTQQRQA